jgi:hypothetical protein
MIKDSLESFKEKIKDSLDSLFDCDWEIVDEEIFFDKSIHTQPKGKWNNRKKITKHKMKIETHYKTVFISKFDTEEKGNKTQFLFRQFGICVDLSKYEKNDFWEIRITLEDAKKTIKNSKDKLSFFQRFKLFNLNLFKLKNYWHRNDKIKKYI